MTPDDCTVFVRRVREGFDILGARLEAVLKDVRVMDALASRNNFQKDTDSDKVTEKTAVRKAVFIRKLGDRLLQLCVPVEASPLKM